MWILKNKILTVKDLIKRQVQIEDLKAHVNEPEVSIPNLSKSIKQLLKTNEPKQSPLWRQTLGKLTP